MSANSFYDSRAWRRVRREVLTMDHHECQLCKARHRHSRAEIVHHRCHLDQYPDVSEYPTVKAFFRVEDPATGERRRNLVSVCRACHETVCHPERLVQAEARGPLTPERW